MKVEHKLGGSLHGVEGPRTKHSTKTGFERAGITETSPGTHGSAKVDVSDRAQLMQKAKEIASRNQIDEAKVARLQKLIDEGKYSTDAHAIADRLVDEHMSFPE